MYINETPSSRFTHLSINSQFAARQQSCLLADSKSDCSTMLRQYRTVRDRNVVHLRIDITDVQCTMKTHVILGHTMKAYIKLMRCNISIAMVPTYLPSYKSCHRRQDPQRFHAPFLLYAFHSLLVQIFLSGRRGRPSQIYWT